jgi:hypothetical protein
MDYTKANKKHLVEDEWHYPIMTKFGYEPLEKFQLGLVRSYKYKKNGHEITLKTGVNSDYWRDDENNTGGFWADLEPHLKKIN